ncbi:MAG TPA: hypothetical protein VK872_09085 [Draconibacterium sp.]|jgi:hypothetical protein|nr:hypothetical protein [Draconibacterium sp.]
MDKLTYNLTKKTVQIFGLMVVVGLVALIYGFFGEPSGKRVAANLLLNNFYFLSMGLVGLFFVAVHAISESGWHLSVSRIGEAMAAYIPVGGVLLLLFFIFGGLHHIYEWTHEEHLDALLLKKTPYLNQPFFYIRAVVILSVWSALAWYIRKTSLQIDINGDLKYFKKLRMLSAVFIVFYALSSVVSAWDWLMSIDAHWFSTLYGWYIFSGMLASGTALIIIILYILKRMGYMAHVNKEHIHDLGKYLFGFSIFWTYLWFSQYMLIWYANIPEETVYFYTRHKNYETILYLTLVTNFVIPFFFLMARKLKRIYTFLLPVSAVVFIGHWINLYLTIMPGAVGREDSGIGFLEIGLTIGFIGLFMLVTMRALTKAPLASVKHPFYKESMHYHTNY